MIWLILISAGAVFGLGVTRSLGGAMYNPATTDLDSLRSAQQEAGKMLAQGIVMMIVGGLVAGCTLASMIS